MGIIEAAILTAVIIIGAGIVAVIAALLICKALKILTDDT